ncbi:MAG: 8-amino-7-oxononanoate synthase, partial [Candidatus Omnitrophica bacterium]|nr:8-amino-7-oxononanoate synthase [Candidatus Omnitrophota bacterium]
MARVEEILKERAYKGLLRTLRPSLCRKDGCITIDGKSYVDFCSNDYLGLSCHPKLKKASKKSIDALGTGTCASRLLSGDLEIHHTLEEATAAFKGKESALVFNSGYQANIGIISALYKEGDVVFSDKLNHASIIDGILLSGAKLIRFFHNDAGHLATLLKKERGKYKEALIITESIFSMEGDAAPLKELAALKEKYNCALMVDEAHATGIFGKHGAGMVEEQGVTEGVDYLMGTFGKALGSFGAYLACSKKIKDFLINTCRSFIYSTSLPAAVIAANLAALEVIHDEPLRRKRLLEHAAYF